MKTCIALMVTLVMSCPSLSVAEEGDSAGGHANRATTVKSSKSNSSERSVKAKNPATKDAATHDGVPTDRPRENAAHHDSSKSSIRNMK